MRHLERHRIIPVKQSQKRQTTKASHCGGFLLFIAFSIFFQTYTDKLHDITRASLNYPSTILIYFLYPKIRTLRGPTRDYHSICTS
ncbi:hypothetical protein VCHA49P381_120096 [Vibrio chagasii]|nr:hypothetical protein VCHA49P381_120096 [Vibrio chagasii]